MRRWPWVSRSLYEQVVGQWQEAVKRLDVERQMQYDAREREVDAARRAGAAEVRANILEAGNRDLRQWLEAKDAAILAMKREGFDPPDPRPPTTHEIRAKLDPAILHRIEQIAQPGTKEHFVMLQEAEALIAAYPDRPAEQIADEVTEGSPISPYRL